MCVPVIVLLRCSYPFACSLAPYTSRITGSQSAHSCRLTIHQHDVAYGLPSHFLGQSINQLGNAFICGIQQEPSIDFLPSLCPLPLPARATGKQAIKRLLSHAIRPTTAVQAQGVSRSPNTREQISHARHHATLASASAPLSALMSLSAGHICICICIHIALIFSLAATD